MTLKELCEALLLLEEEHTDFETGEFDEEGYAAALKDLESELDDKIHAYAEVILSAREEAEGVRAQKKAYVDAADARMRGLESRAKRLERALTHFLGDQNGPWRTDRTRVWFEESKAVEIVDASVLPDSVMRWKPEPDKKKIREEIEKGNEEVIQGARFTGRVLKVRR